MKMISRNILWHEIRQYWKGVLIWAMVLVGLATLYLSLYPALVEQTSVFKDLLESFPPEFKELFGINELAVTSLSGFIGFTFTYVILLGAIQSMSLGISMFAKEVSNKTSDFLMTKPVSRMQILASKMLAGLGLVMLLNLIFMVALFFVTQAILSEPMSLSVYILTTMTLFLTQIFFLPLGYLLGIWLKKVKSVIAVSLPVVLGFYVVGMLDSLIGKGGIKLFTPFKFFDYEYISVNSAYEWQILIFEGVIILVLIILSRKIYLSKDIHSV